MLGESQYINNAFMKVYTSYTGFSIVTIYNLWSEVYKLFNYLYVCSTTISLFIEFDILWVDDIFLSIYYSFSTIIFTKHIIWYKNIL